MFEAKTFDGVRAAARSAAAEPSALATSAQRRDALRDLQAAMDILEGVHAALLAELDEAGEYADDGASSTASWARQELRLPPVETRARLKAGRTLAHLPATATAMASGQLRLAHVKELSAGITKGGAALIADAEPILLPVATSCDPIELREAITALLTVAHPHDLDEAYVRGMDKQDVQLSKAGDGYHLSGFLDIVNGSLVKTWLNAAAAPTGSDDTRTAPQRRVDALGTLTGSALEHGLPSDRGIRPQLHVLCELETLRATQAAASGRGPADPVEPAQLAGFGPIGADLLGYLSCGADRTEILVDGHTSGPTPQARVLNVGRTRRLATDKQRHAVRARQGGTCAAPGCTHTHLDVHHARWWDRDHGPTDLDNLVGLCSRCHHLVHRQKLSVTADGVGGFTFSRRTGIKIEDHRRLAQHRLRQRLRALSLPAHTRDQESCHRQPSQLARASDAQTASTSSSRQQSSPPFVSRIPDTVGRGRVPDPPSSDAPTQKATDRGPTLPGGERQSRRSWPHDRDRTTGTDPCGRRSLNEDRLARALRLHATADQSKHG